MATFWLEHAKLPSGWADAVRIEVADGMIVAVVADVPPGGDERLPGLAVPGIPNVHSHAFQRGMAGLTEIRGPGDDSFWTWREVMYRFLGRLDPQAVEAIAAYAYMRMLEAGYTAVGEFHYLHHDPMGRPYADPAELCGRIVQAAASTGIGLTLLPCFYRRGGFDAAPPAPGQRRFINDPDSFLRLLESAKAHLAGLPGARLGIAPHSLRAVTPADLRTLLAATPSGPVHIHAAEQMREVAECRAALGAPPVAWLLGDVGPRWCLVHATHMDAEETVALARSGAVAGLCPLTEADLGDGIFPGKHFVETGGRFGIGSDSNVITDPAAELRQFETAQRLALRSRNILAQAPGSSIGAALLAGALTGGARALDQPTGAIAPGRRADIVVLDAEHPDLAGRGGDKALDTWVFVAPNGLVRHVVAGGRHVVRDGCHVTAGPIIAAWRRAMAGLAEA